MHCRKKSRIRVKFVWNTHHNVALKPHIWKYAAEKDRIYVTFVGNTLSIVVIWRRTLGRKQGENLCLCDDWIMFINSKF